MAQTILENSHQKDSHMNKYLASVPLAALFAVCMPLAAGDAPHWTYSGETGPDRWAELGPQFSACAGKNQAPIDLAHPIDAKLKPIAFSYKAGGSEMLNNGHTVQVNYVAGSSITVDGVQFDLKQFHFHSPSENHVNGKSFVMEAHLVHADKDGNLAVVALLFNEGLENKALAKIWSSIPKKAGDKVPLAAPFAVAELLPSSHDYFRFNGSLTTPPCTEGVRWLVMKKPLLASKAQVEAFAHAIHHPNNRPIQPVNARPVLE
jgi:carbonic anhydrase